MKYIILITSVYLLASCSNPSPQQYFNTAALNCNLLYEFGSGSLQQQLSSPPAQLTGEKNGATRIMKRAELLQMKTENIEENYQKIKALPQNNEAAAMIKASLALYEYILPVYKKEYSSLAKLYDENAGAEKTAALEKEISHRYNTRFEQLYQEVLNEGKAYAKQHNIMVREVSPSPR